MALGAAGREVREVAGIHGIGLPEDFSSRKMFLMFDTDEDGALDSREFRKAMKNLIDADQFQRSVIAQYQFALTMRKLSKMTQLLQTISDAVEPRSGVVFVSI